MAAFLPATCRPRDGRSPSVAGWTADLGSGGCALFLPERFPVGTLLDLVLGTPGGDLPSRGVVVRAGPPTSASGHLVEHGLQFSTLRPEQAGRLGEVLEAMLARPEAATGPPGHTSSPSPA
jgi:hypothetical protein